MKDVPGFVLRVLALLFFLGAALMLAAILTATCCGVGFWSPQVSWGNRLLFLAVPVVPFLLGVGCLIIRRATREPMDVGK